MVSHGDEHGRQSRRSSDTKVPSDGLSDGSTHDSDLHRSRQSKAQEFTSLEAFANPKRENWCDVRDDDDSDDREDLWLSASPFKDSHASPVSPATPSRRRPANPRRRKGHGRGDSPREEPIQHAGRPVAQQPAAQIPGSVVTIADIGLPCTAPPVPPKAAPAPPPMWAGIMSTSPIEQPRPAVFLPHGALGAPGGPPVGSPMNAGSTMPVGSPTGDASTRAIYAGSPTFMQAPMTPMTPVDPSMRAQWPDGSPVYQQPCAWPWPQGPAPMPGPPMAQPPMAGPPMVAPSWPQEAQWSPGGMAQWQGFLKKSEGVQPAHGAYMVMGDGMGGYAPNMEA